MRSGYITKTIDLAQASVSFERVMSQGDRRSDADALESGRP